MSTARRYCVTISYDGTDYNGWQWQKEDESMATVGLWGPKGGVTPPTGKGKGKGKGSRYTRSIQSVLEFRLNTYLRRCPSADNWIRLYSCGRTDKGVHAQCMIAHFDIDDDDDSHTPQAQGEHLMRAWGSNLPIDIQVTNIRRVSPLFHALNTPHCKTYVYTIHLHRADVFQSRYTWSLHLQHAGQWAGDAVERAAQALLGTHDYSTFGKHDDKATTIKTVSSIEVDNSQLPLIKIAFRGPGFLWRQVRCMTGYLVAVGCGKLEDSTAAVYLQQADRTLAKQWNTAPACGLCLHRCDYEDNGAPEVEELGEL